MITETTYSEINNSFKKQLVYHLGGEAGFFSEYNNMILAMLYCLKNQIRFVLYSKDAIFGIQKGWDDYFLPFCDESFNILHSKFNPRQILGKNSYFFSIKQSLFKKLNKIDYLSTDIWNKFHNKNFEDEYFDIQQIGISGTTRQASKKIIDITWRFNSQTSECIKQNIDSLKIPTPYIGFHIRGGDKFVEYSPVDIDVYMRKAYEKTDIRNAFVLTDDYRILIQLKEKYSDWNFFSFCSENEVGYNHQNFKNNNQQAKKEQMIKLFASMEILGASNHFIGTFSSNPGMFLGMKMKRENVHGVDFDKWTIW